MDWKPNLNVDVRMGDILVQRDKTIWTKLAQFIAGQPYPHALIVEGKGISYVDCYESGPIGIEKKQIAISMVTRENYELWRPNCSFEIKLKAVEWMIQNDDALYDYGNLLLLAVMCRFGFRRRVKKQANKMFVCSEAISAAYHTNGYDLVPELEDSDTKPWDLRNEKTCTRVF